MSKLIMFDFECEMCGKRFEDLVPATWPAQNCPACGFQAKKLISPVRINKLDMAMSGSASPESVNYFDKVHRERKAIEDKKYHEHGDYGSAAGAD
jgi:putative FmdB family regulatory protein